MDVFSIIFLFVKTAAVEYICVWIYLTSLCVAVRTIGGTYRKELLTAHEYLESVPDASADVEKLSFESG